MAGKVGQMTFMTDDIPLPPRRRNASPEAVASREAASFVRDLNRQLGFWQASSVKLHTMAERLTAAGRADPSVAEEAHALFNVVSTEALRFESLLPELTEAVAGHDRIKDTRRSFEMITERLRDSLRLMGSEPKAE